MSVLIFMVYKKFNQILIFALFEDIGYVRKTLMVNKLQCYYKIGIFYAHYEGRVHTERIA